MIKTSWNRVLVAGILSPLGAAFLGFYVYAALTRASENLDQDFVRRLLSVTVAMTVPFLVTLLLAIRDVRRGTLTKSGKVGLGIAVLSLSLTWVPIRGLVGRAQQARNVAIQDLAAPLFDTVDLMGKPHRLQDHIGKVVLINAWATWCPPCREEMPLLDQLYASRRDRGLMVFGLSTEDLDVQRKFVREQLSVNYPLLSVEGEVPSLYQDIQRWPAIFLIDRNGKLQPAPQAGESFDQVEAAVDALLRSEN